MSSNPFYRRLDDDLFPELQLGPQRKGVRALMLPPLGDPRVTTPRHAKVLLVVFRLDQPAAASEPSTALRGWHLSFDRLDAQGRLQRERVPVVPEPKDGNTSRRPLPDAGPPPPGRPIYRGAWWTDLAGLFASGLLQPGMAVQVAWAGQPGLTLNLV